MHVRHCQDEHEGIVDEGRYKDWDNSLDSTSEEVTVSTWYHMPSEN
jgi:hypothetical protein